MGKHVRDETAEFALPRRGRHASPDTGELEVTPRPESEPHASPDDGQAR